MNDKNVSVRRTFWRCAEQDLEMIAWNNRVPLLLRKLHEVCWLLVVNASQFCPVSITKVSQSRGVRIIALFVACGAQYSAMTAAIGLKIDIARHACWVHESAKDMSSNEPEIMTPEEAATYLRLGEQTMYRLLRAGTVPAAKLGRQWRVRKSDLDSFFHSRAGRQSDTGLST